MISSGNVLPPPAYGVVCDIDVNNHDPIKQRARQIPLSQWILGYIDDDESSEGVSIRLRAGHFEWLRMPFGLKNAPIIYQRMLDNALCGFVQPKGGWNHFAE
ncbi:hypothetical protein PHMEG_00030359, partial [Phytophthora megakarya]